MSGKLIEMPKKNELKVLNKSETVAEILLYGPIGANPWDPDSVSAKDFVDALKKIPASVKTIELRVNSPGGSVFDGMAIYERLKNHSAKVIAYVDGVAASMASVIVLAADEVVLGEGAMYMIHKPLVMTYGNADEHERMIDILDKIESQMITIYAKKTGLSRAEIATAMAKETYYTAEQAVELGYGDKVSAGGDSLKVAAIIDAQLANCPWIKNKPAVKNSNDIIREKLRKFNQEAKEFLNKAR